MLTKKSKDMEQVKHEAGSGLANLVERAAIVETNTHSPAENADGTDRCDTDCAHADVVEQVKREAVELDRLNDLAELFKALSDQTRLRIIHSLLNRELCVCDLCDVLGMQQSAVSHQLRVLRNLRIVKRRKEGKMMYYSIDDQHVEGLFLQALHHISHK